MNIEIFDGRREHLYDVVIVSSDGSNIQLNTSSINNLTIEDNILSPFMYGSIAVNNVRNILETKIDDVKPLNLAGNNRDYIYVNIMPKITKKIESDIENEKLQKIFNLKCIFSINETQDKETPESQFLSMMTFRDVHQQILMESSIEFSTLEIARNIKKIPTSALIHLNDSERTANAGDVIKVLLTKIFEAKDGIEVDDEKGFGIKKQDFETGMPILWSSTGSANAHDSLMYITNKLLISKDYKDRCLLNFCRYNRKFSLLSYAHIFSKQQEDPANFVLESFVLDSDQSSQSNKTNNTGSIGLDQISYITEFKYTALNGNDVTKNFTNSVFQKTVGIDRNFCFMSEKSSLNQIFNEYKNLYLEPFKKIEKNATSSVDLEHLIKMQKARPKIIYDTRPLAQLDILKSNALLDMLLNGGSNIIFRCPGSTHRRSGKFIDITSNTSFVDAGPAAKNLLGRWFVTSVSHVFIGSNYYNVIEAIKTYTP